MRGFHKRSSHNSHRNSFIRDYPVGHYGRVVGGSLLLVEGGGNREGAAWSEGGSAAFGGSAAIKNPLVRHALLWVGCDASREIVVDWWLIHDFSVRSDSSSSHLVVFL